MVIPNLTERAKKEVRFYVESIVHINLYGMVFLAED
jgi:hypothetical protein